MPAKGVKGAAISKSILLSEAVLCPNPNPYALPAENAPALYLSLGTKPSWTLERSTLAEEAAIIDLTQTYEFDGRPPSRYFSRIDQKMHAKKS